MEKGKRNSSIELLRVLAIMMVIALHYNKEILGNTFETTRLTGYLLMIVEALSIVAVNCFVLITGYFSIHNKSLKVRKIVDLLWLTSFYGIAIYCFACVLGENTFSIEVLLECVLPYFFDKVWFINCYCFLSLLSPFINKAVLQLSKRAYLMLLLIVVILFSVWPTFLPNPPSTDNGYGIISFVMIYLIGGYIRLHMQECIGHRKLMMIAAGGYLVFSAITIKVSFFYNNIFVVLASVCLFLFFLSIKFSSKPINYLSQSVIAVLTIHTHQSIRPHLFSELFKVQNYLSGFSYIFYLCFVVICVFVACTLIDFGRRVLFKHTFDKWFDKIVFMNATYEV